jgi:hypothetical protein
MTKKSIKELKANAIMLWDTSSGENYGFNQLSGVWQGS